MSEDNNNSVLVLGLGNTHIINGIVSKLGEYPQYEIKSIIATQKYKEPEDYEKNFSPKDYEYLTEYNKSEQEILVVLSGADYFSSTVLKLLSMVKDARISVLFLKSNLIKAKKKDKLHQRVLLGILQEYARSGLFEEIILIDYARIQHFLNGVSIKDFLSNSIDIVVSPFHMTNVLKNQEPLLGDSPEKENYERISTIGIVDLSSNNEQSLYEIKGISSKSYLFLINEDKIEKDTTLLNKINSRINENTETATISYGVYSSEFENDYAYVISRTGNIQQED